MDRPTLLDRVRTEIANRPPAPSRGFEGRLPPDVREQLLEIRRQFQSGDLNVSASWLADHLIAMAAEDGFAVCGRQGLRSWLADKG